MTNFVPTYCSKCGMRMVPAPNLCTCQPTESKNEYGKLEWQPIETAPKGRKVLAGYFNKLGNWRTITAKYYLPDTLESEHTESGFADEGWYEESDSIEEIMPTDCEPTHWMPLPTPPYSVGRGGQVGP